MSVSQFSSIRNARNATYAHVCINLLDLLLVHVVGNLQVRHGECPECEEEGGIHVFPDLTRDKTLSSHTVCQDISNTVLTINVSIRKRHISYFVYIYISTICIHKALYLNTEVWLDAGNNGFKNFIASLDIPIFLLFNG